VKYCALEQEFFSFHVLHLEFSGNATIEPAEYEFKQLCLWKCCTVRYGVQAFSCFCALFLLKGAQIFLLSMELVIATYTEADDERYTFREELTRHQR
jgi:hypothetical protein